MRARFPKPAREYEIVSVYGPNIIACEGEEWKKYRKICVPAFSDVCIILRLVGYLIEDLFYPCQRNNKLVWDETTKIVNALFNEVWEGKDVISVDHAVEITLPVWVYCNDLSHLRR